MQRQLHLLLAAAGAVLVSACASDPHAASELRMGRFVFSDWPGPPLNVFYVEPDGAAGADGPVVIVMHGVNRNADEYAANWRALVREHGLRVYAPEFSDDAFPGAPYYNLGGLGQEDPSAYSAIEPLFDAITAQRGAAEGYYLFGHSAGSQFVHRALLFEELPRLVTAYAANAGWYTLPDLTVAWPYGLEGAPVDEADMTAWLARPMIVLLGDQDTDAQASNLRRTPEAAAQGPHRYARGFYFAAQGLMRAQERDASFGWTVITVPGVAHDNAGMAIPTAALIAEHARSASDADE